MARILIVDDSPSQLIGMRRTVEKLLDELQGAVRRGIQSVRERTGG